MGRVQRTNESRFLNQVVRYRVEYRNTRAAALREERERRHAAGEVCVEGCWIAREDADRAARGLQRHEMLAFLEIAALLIVLLATAYGAWRLFLWLLVPEIG